MIIDYYLSFINFIPRRWEERFNKIERNDMEGNNNNRIIVNEEREKNLIKKNKKW